MDAKLKNYPLVLAPSSLGICNLTCIYCYMADIMNKESILKYADHVSVLDQMKTLGCKYVIYAMEGEPFLDQFFHDRHKDTFPLVEDANRRGMYVVVFTNMTMFTEEKLKTLHKMNISIIGKLNAMDSNIHNSLMNREEKWESYDGIFLPKGIKLLLEAGFNKCEKGMTRLGVDIVITRKNLHHIEGVIEFCDKYNIKPIIDTLIPSGNARKNLDVLELDENDNRWLYKLLRDRWGDEFVNDQFIEGCAIGEVGLAYDSSGNVKACCTLGADIGNIKQESIKVLFENVQKYRSTLPKYEKSKDIINMCARAKLLTYHHDVTE